MTSEILDEDPRREDLPALCAAFHDIAPEYEILNKDGQPLRDQPGEPVGFGGSSVVLRGRYKQSLNRALKFMIPRETLKADAPGIEVFLDNFRNEVMSLADLTHDNVARLDDFGTVNFRNQEIPYLVTELVYPAQSIVDFSRSPEVSGTEIMYAISQMFRAVAFLHDHRVMHCDLKPSNVLVDREGGSGRIRTVILDLGVAHRLGEGSPDDYTYFFASRGYHLAALANVVANKSYNRVTKKDLEAYFPAQDIFSVGRILTNILDEQNANAKLRRSLGTDASSALRYIANGMATERENQRYADIRSAHVHLERVSRNSVSPLANPDLAEHSLRGVVLPHLDHRVSTTGRIEAVISHPVMQRLHQLPQLDLIKYVLPGATNSRFAHALRQFELTRKAINHQLVNWDFRLGVAAEDIDLTLWLSLVDSVGRYQLHHMFEDFLKHRERYPEAGLVYPAELLNGLMGDTSFGWMAPLADKRDERGRTFAEATGLDWPSALRLRNSPSDRVKGFLAGLLDSPLDVNKLAYLQADSHSSGMPFGRAISEDALFENLCLPNQSDWEREPLRIVLGLREDGISYAENVVLTRYWNIQTGYWNRTNRALQSMVKYVIAELIRHRKLDFSDFCARTFNSTALRAIRELSDRFDACVKAGDLPEESVNPISQMVRSIRNPYRRLLTISPKSNVLSRGPDAKIYSMAADMSPLEEFALCQIVADTIRTVVPSANPRPGEILLDVPRSAREDSRGQVLVYSDEPDAGLIERLNLASPLLSSLGASFELNVKRLRFYVHPDLSAKLEPHVGRLHVELLDRLRHEASRRVPI